MPSTELVVLGAGPAGLAAAWRAAAAGHEVTVLERSAAVGGLAASFDVAGVRVDHGSHRLHPSTDPRILAELRRLLGSDLQLRRRHGRIRLLDRWVRFPLRPADSFRALPPRFAAALARDLVLAPLRRPHADTFAEVVRAGLGPAMLRDFYGPYARKLWGLAPEELSGDQARRRVQADSVAKIAVRALRTGRGGGPTFWYPRRGFGTIPEVLAGAAADAGATVVTGAEVAALSLRGDGATVALADGRAFDARRVWSTVPLPALARLAGAPAPVLDAAARLSSRALVLVYLAVDRRPWTEFDAHYFPGLDTAVSRISEPANYRSSPDDPPDRTVLCAELPCAPGDALWSTDDERLGELVRADLVAQGLPDPEPTGVVVRRVPSAYPVSRVGSEVDVAVVDAWVTEQPALLAFGRQGLFVHDNTHHALAMAWDAASALRDDGFDQRAWAAARARFRSHVVED